MTDGILSKNQGTLKCLILQLGRQSDCIQSLMALRAAKQLYPELSITFVCRERFSATAKRIPWIREVITLPTERVLAPILNAEIPTGLTGEREALSNLAQWIRPLIESPWDLLFNWSYTESSSFLTALLPARVKLGYSRRNDGLISNIDGWSQFMYGVVQAGISQNIHLTDILTTQILTALQIHVGDPTDAGSTTVTSKSFFDLKLKPQEIPLTSREPGRKWISIQLNSTGKTEETALLVAELADLILTRHPETRIQLLGSPAQTDLERLVLKELKTLQGSLTRVTSHVGKMSFDLWASVIGRSQWLISDELTSIHLASVLGTRVLAYFPHSKRFREVGPYGNGHYLMTPITANASFTAEAVYGVWSYASTEWAHRRQLSLKQHFLQLGWSSEFDLIRACRSRIRGTQDGGGIVYEDLKPESMDLESWSAQAIGHIARAWYCGWTPEVAAEVSREAVSPVLVQQLRKLLESTTVIRHVCDELKRTSLQMRDRANRLKSQKLMDLRDRAAIQELGQKLQELEVLLARASRTQEPLPFFEGMHRVLMHNLRGQNVLEMSQETAEIQVQLLEAIGLLEQWIKITLERSKPVAVRGAAVVPFSPVARPEEVSP